VYARVAAATGWSFEYIGSFLTLPRLASLYRYWREAPPVAESVAAFLGIRTTDASPRSESAQPLTNAEVVRGTRADPRLAKWVSDPALLRPPTVN
jgi:hypothetical protein